VVTPTGTLGDRTLAPGRELAGFRIDSELGRGGMSVVYLATQLRLGRQVALKLLDPELVRDRDFRNRFIRESQAAAMLEDPNVLPVYDAGEADGHLYIAMRYVDGTDLAQLLRDRGTLAPKYVRSLVEQIGGALDTAHQAGLVHRDVKPGNILIDRRGLAFLCDFGLAKRMQSREKTAAGKFMGTVDYCAPEQIAGRATDGRTDVYGLAAVAYHALAGRPPFERESELATAEAHLTDPPPKLSARRPDLPPGLGEVLERAMAKAPGDRYGTPVDFADAFSAALGHGSEEADLAELGLDPTEPSTAAEAATRVLPQAAPAAGGGRLTTDVLRATAEKNRGPLWKKRQRWRIMTRVFKAPDPTTGRLTDDLLAAKLEEERARRSKRRKRKPS
jgi:serine/threonine protein kinase